MWTGYPPCHTSPFPFFTLVEEKDGGGTEIFKSWLIFARIELATACSEGSSITAILTPYFEYYIKRCN